MTAELLDRGFRAELLQQGFDVAFDALGRGSASGSHYLLAQANSVEEGDRVAYVVPRDDGFVILVEVAGADVSRDAIEQLRSGDSYSLVAFPPAIDGVSNGGWSMAELIGDHVWDQFPGWEVVVADPEVSRQFVQFLVSRAQLLKSYAWGMVQRVAAGPDSREDVFGPLQSLINTPEDIEAGTVLPSQVIEQLRRAFTTMPDGDSFESLRMWFAGQAMQEMAGGRLDGPWVSISIGANDFGKERGWY
ncbi:MULTISPECIES: hypothetical protein [unclassified Rathayibacter]|uniref:hypothetical protein n=1 Tax=unclassified Rathayibacter TaxID=2609250 RepID=UPI0007016820|nr:MULTISPECIES: hypothetical protein [unclassified Rathayibacter]KQQ05882.1 hypothetical protein ASF42_04885 [Rathayibacter sp. Leaf294]KQS13739.1 hypothetical protein ASG06_04895 [Rathayibacter sp. Leaf185]